MTHTQKSVVEADTHANSRGSLRGRQRAATTGDIRADIERPEGCRRPKSRAAAYVCSIGLHDAITDDDADLCGSGLSVHVLDS